jgi:hypothetical protein
MGREIMMHSYSPSSRQLAVPGIGFPQNISIDPDVLDLAAVRDWSDDRFDAPRNRLTEPAPEIWTGG